MPNRLSVAAFVLLAPLAVAAQVIPVPKALLFPNYDNVLVGKNQALEAGAYIARVNDASSNFYNPAGLVASEKTQLNASSTGYVYSRISSTASGASLTASKLDNLPGYFGAVLEPPFVDTRDWRIGISLTRNVSWSPGGIDQTIAPTASDFDRVTFSTEANFTTLLYQLAAAWAPLKSLRLGASGGLAQTSFSSRVTLSGATSPEGQPGQFLSTLRANGTDYSIVFAIGAQWDVLAGLTIGAVVRPPGLHVTNSSLVTQESSFAQAAGATSSYFRDDNAAFRYKLPTEASVGVSYRFGSVELEGDLRYHDAVSQYDFYRSNVPYQVLTQANGTSSITTQAPPVVTNSARRVFNGAVGANLRMGRIATLHGGFYSSLSPVEKHRHLAVPQGRPLRLHGWCRFPVREVRRLAGRRLPVRYISAGGEHGAGELRDRVRDLGAVHLDHLRVLVPVLGATRPGEPMHPLAGAALASLVAAAPAPPELLARDKVSLDIFWLKDESLEDSANLLPPDVIAAEIAEDLRAALEQFEAIQADLNGRQ